MAGSSVSATNHFVKNPQWDCTLLWLGQANAINDNGVVVGQQVPYDTYGIPQWQLAQAVFWQAGVISNPTPNSVYPLLSSGSSSNAVAINNSNKVVGTKDGGHLTAATWQVDLTDPYDAQYGGTYQQAYLDLNFNSMDDGFGQAYATGVSNSGVISGYYLHGSGVGLDGTVWHGGDATGVYASPGSKFADLTTTSQSAQHTRKQSVANAVNDNGVFVGSVYPASSARQAAYWFTNNRGGYSIAPTIPAIGYIPSEFTSVNASGQAVGYVWQSQTQFPLFYDPASQVTKVANVKGHANSINNLGISVGSAGIIGKMFNSAYISNDNATIQDLNDLVWVPNVQLTEARGINNHNQVVGTASDSITNRSIAFIAEPHPLTVNSVTNITAAITSTPSIVVKWDDANNGQANHYLIRGDAQHTSDTVFLPVATGALQYIDTAISVSDVYTYYVVAYNSSGEATYAPQVTVGWPAVPTNLAYSTNANEGQVVLTWTHDMQFEDSFVVQRQSQTESAYHTIGATALSDGLTFTDSILDPNLTYSYRVCAREGNFWSAFSTPVIFNPVSSAVHAPTNLKAFPNFASQAQSKTSVVLSWIHDSSPRNGYYIERLAAGDASFVRIGKVVNSTDTNLQYVDTITPSKQYTYRVQTFLNVNVSQFSNQASINASPSISLVPVDGDQSVSSLTGSIQITASSLINADSLVVSLDNDPPVSGSSVALIPQQVSSDIASGTTVFSVKLPLPKSGPYILSATAVDSSHQTTSVTNHFSYIRDEPLAPSNLVATVFDGIPPTIRLTWQVTDPSAQYIVERQSPSGPFTQVSAALATGTAAWTDLNATSSPTNDATYGYRVKGVVGALESEYTKTAFATISATNSTGNSFKNLSPLHWTNSARPVISADATAFVDPTTLFFDLSQTTGNITINGVVPVLVGNHVSGTPASDLADGAYNVAIRAAGASQMWTFSVDTTAPAIAGLPAIKSVTHLTTPGAGFNCTITDNLSGVDRSSTKITLDNVDITASATIGTGSSISAAFVLNSDLAIGYHTVIVSASDLAGNVVSADCVLSVVVADTTPPVFTDAWPAPGGYVTLDYNLGMQRGFPMLSVNLTDDNSGVDTGSMGLSISADPQNLNRVMPTVSPTGLTFPLQYLWNMQDGINYWRAQAKDLSGNGPAVFNSVFIIDSTPPAISIEGNPHSFDNENDKCNGQ